MKEHGIQAVAVVGKISKHADSSGSGPITLGADSNLCVIGMLSAFDVLIGWAGDEEAGKRTRHPNCANLIGKAEEGRQMMYFPPSGGLHWLSEPMQKGMHRVLSRRPDGRLVVVSQTDLLRFIISSNPLDQLEAIKWKTDLIDAPISIQHETRVLDAALKLSDYNHRACPIVSSDNVVVGTISSSDIRGFTPADIDAYAQQPISSIIPRRPPVSVRKETTPLEVCQP